MPIYLAVPPNAAHSPIFFAHLNNEVSAFAHTHKRQINWKSFDLQQQRREAEVSWALEAKRRRSRNSGSCRNRQRNKANNNQEKQIKTRQRQTKQKLTAEKQQKTKTKTKRFDQIMPKLEAHCSFLLLLLWRWFVPVALEPSSIFSSSSTSSLPEHRLQLKLSLFSARAT